MRFWPAPTLANNTAIDAKISIPASKSLTNRYLILAALSAQPTTIYHPLRARDTFLMLTALRALGVEIQELPSGDGWQVFPDNFRGGKIQAGLAGTVMRFIPPVAALAHGETLLDGDLQARKRPMRTTIESLHQLGVEISGSGSNSDTLPLRISGTGEVRGGEVTIDASASSQFVSALLLAGARFQNGVTLRHVGTDLPSMPHIQMTLSVLQKCGVQVVTKQIDGNPVWQVQPGKIQLPPVTVESDLSNAGPFLAAAVVCGGKIVIPNWPRETTQPGAKFAEILASTGAKVNYLPDGALELIGTAEIAPLDLDCHAIGELVPTLAAVCAFATGDCALRNIGQLRGHETDRLAALVAELSKVGVFAHIDGDDLLISPPTDLADYRGGKILSYADHRMATFGAILGLRIPQIEVENIETTAKTLPNFVELWEQLIMQSVQSAQSATPVQPAQSQYSTQSAHSSVLDSVVRATEAEVN